MPNGLVRFDRLPFALRARFRWPFRLSFSPLFREEADCDCVWLPYCFRATSELKWGEEIIENTENTLKPNQKPNLISKQSILEFYENSSATSVFGRFKKCLLQTPNKQQTLPGKTPDFVCGGCTVLHNSFSRTWTYAWRLPWRYYFSNSPTNGCQCVCVCVCVCIVWVFECECFLSEVKNTSQLRATKRDS